MICERNYFLQSKTIKIDDLLDAEFPKTITKNFVLKLRRCHQKDMKFENAECIETQITEISEVGK